MFSLGQYFDQDTGRSRYGAFDNQSQVWYFPSQYGKIAVERLVSRLNTSS